jgi:hypothetical protein
LGPHETRPQGGAELDKSEVDFQEMEVLEILVDAVYREDLFNEGMFPVHGLPLPGGAGLEFIIGCIVGKNRLEGSYYAKKSKRKIPKKSHAIMHRTNIF